MKKIVLFGPLGMLGSAVYGVLREHYRLVLVLRDTTRLSILNAAYGGVKEHQVVQFDSENLTDDFHQKGFSNLREAPTWTKLVTEIGPVDGVVNCIGVTNRFSQHQPLAAYFINSALPHLLAHTYGHKLLHITTDCVFNGNEGAPYTETSVPSPTDLYGLTKMLGEPANRSLVLRTSIIGPEVTGYVSLLEWVRKQSGKKIKGYTRHHWNGITTKQFGRIAHQIFSQRDQFPSNGLFHIYSSDVTKFEMVSAIAKKYSVNTIIEADSGPVLDRRLRTVHDVRDKLQIPTFIEMLNDL